ncbi:ABC transporter ATP-binding protein [Bacteroidota bacterium]
MRTVEVFNLTKIYDARFKQNRVTALRNLDLSVEQGTVFGLLGPNGAGKTTLVKILLGITFPTEGKAKVLGRPISDYKVRKYIGYLPENHKFPSYLTGEGVLQYFAKLSGFESKELDKKIDELLSLVKMEKWKKTKIKKYSKGMMQRLGLAQAMINNPEMIFLDEPTDGVDPIGRKEIRDILVDLKDRGKTIFLNSHLLSEVELITDRVAILHKGELIQEGTVEDLTTTKETYTITLVNELTDEFITKTLSDFTIEKSGGNIYKARVVNMKRLNELIDKIRGADLEINSIVPQKKSLEDMFISLINKTDEKNSK